MDRGRQAPDDDLLFQLSEYVDGKLEGEALAAFERRLAGDSALRRELAAFRKVDAMTRQYRAPVPELDWAAFGALVRDQRIQRGPRARRSFVLRLARPMAAAAALAFALTAVVFLRPSQTTTPDDPAILGPQSPRPSVGVNASDQRGGAALPTGRLSVSVSRALPDDALATVPEAPSGWALVVTTDETPPGRLTGDSLF